MTFLYFRSSFFIIPFLSSQKYNSFLNEQIKKRKEKPWVKKNVTRFCYVCYVVLRSFLSRNGCVGVDAWGIHFALGGAFTSHLAGAFTSHLAGAFTSRLADLAEELRRRLAGRFLRHLAGPFLRRLAGRFRRHLAEGLLRDGLLVLFSP